jgi:murein DD-endopeptidase MepM/ murein hydrolase activator NlpD
LHGGAEFLKGKHLGQIALHAAMGCASSAMAGGSCKSGATAGAVSAFASPLLPGDGKGFNAGRLVGSAIIGAVASRLSGGKTENGALTAAFSYLFNEAAEAMKAEKGWVWPVPGQSEINPRNAAVGQGDGQFGWTRNGGEKHHDGIDIGGYEGAPVVAAAAGTVVAIRPNPSTSYGIQIAIRHEGDVFSLYTHLSSSSVSPGEVVHAGQQIGEMGRTGNLSNPGMRTHLHFEIRLGSVTPVSAGGRTTSPWVYLTRPSAVPLRNAWWRN